MPAPNFLKKPVVTWTMVSTMILGDRSDMRNLLIAAALVFAGLTGSALAQCEQPTIVFHNTFIAVSAPGNYFAPGCNFTAYDARARVIGWTTRPSPSRAVRPSYFPLYVYGDNPMTPLVDGPAFGEAFTVNSNIIKNCGRMRTRKPLVFDKTLVWGDLIASFVHPGDLNGDQRIDMVDYRQITIALTLEIQDCQYDVNADGVVDATDMGLIGRIALHGDVRSTLGQWAYACPE